jgi:UTP--glucose-1-phosphate uridylyltransferase
MQLQKAVITAAGLGTRFLPAAKAYQKEMVPIMEKPQLQYVIEEALEAGISQIAIVTYEGVNTVQRYFTEEDNIFWRRLASVNKDHVMEEWRALKKSCELIFIEQPTTAQYGNGTPFVLSKDFVGNDPFVAMWGDDIMIKTDPAAPTLIAQLTSCFEKYNPVAVMSACEVPLETAYKCGCYRYVQQSAVPYQADLLIEKPTAETIPSRFANMSRFILTPQVIEELSRKIPGKDSEIWLTDAVNRLMQQGKTVIAPPWQGYMWLQVGDPINWLKANIEIAKRNDKYKDRIGELVASLE